MLPILVIVAGCVLFAAWDFHLFKKIKRGTLAPDPAKLKPPRSAHDERTHR